MRTTISCLMMLALASPVAFVGCDRTVSETTTEHRDSSGTVRQETKTVKEDPAGNVTVDKEKTVRTDTH